MERKTRFAAVLAMAATLVVGMGSSAGALSVAVEQGDVDLRRWTGAEAGFAELVCLTDESKGRGCLTFFGMNTGPGGVAITGRTYLDPDGEERLWTARTGNRFFRLAVYADGPRDSFLRGWGASDPFAGGTVTFAIRVPALPTVPVVIFRHGDVGSPRAITVTLTPTGELVASTPVGPLGVTQGRVRETGWHSVTMSYDLSLGSRFSLAIDGASEISANLPTGGPLGTVDVGIVGPVSVPFVLGVDDYVESTVVHAPIAGARIHYLIPEGATDRSDWTRSHPNSSCKEAAQNWQMVSEDSGVTVQTSNGTLTCGLTTTIDSQVGGLSIGRPGAVDRYRTEGIPSRHAPNPAWASMTGPYTRDLTAQPAEGEQILGMRVRMRAYSANPGALALVGFVDEGTLVKEEFEVGAGSSSSLSRWGVTRTSRPGGTAWTREALGEALLHLESGPAVASKLSVFSVRLDYIWVPA